MQGHSEVACCVWYCSMAGGGGGSSRYPVGPPVRHCRFCAMLTRVISALYLQTPKCCLLLFV